MFTLGKEKSKSILSFLNVDLSSYTSLHIFRNRTAVLLIVLAIFASYSNSFNGEFIYDDWDAIANNSSIRTLYPPHVPLKPDAASSTRNRPIVNYTLALNYAISGLDVWSYHAGNVVIHILAALTLFGVLRQTFTLSRWRTTFRLKATHLAFACSLLWSLHPLQTESVSYLTQRCESLVGLFFLLTFYCSIRSWRSTKNRLWSLLAVVSFLLGVGSKESIVVAPFLIVLFDLIFNRESILGAFKKSRWMYLGFLLGLVLFGIYISPVGMIISTTAGESTQTIFGSLEYARSQPEIILYYLRLSFWPEPLCLSYHWMPTDISRAIPYLVVLSILVLATLFFMVKRHSLGFIGAFFFATLAPTSSFYPLVNLAFEHRMYLPLVSVVIFTLLSVVTVVDRLAARVEQRIPLTKVISYTMTSMLVIVAVVFSSLTYLRNEDYRDRVSIWRDTVQKRPFNVQARNIYAEALYNLGRIDEAIVQFERAIAINPLSSDARGNLGVALMQRGQIKAATIHLAVAAELQPQSLIAQLNYGMAVLEAGDPNIAVKHFENAVALHPDSSALHSGYGLSLFKTGKIEASLRQFETALVSEHDAEVHLNYGVVLKQLKRGSEADQQFREAQKHDPNLRVPQIDDRH